MPDNKKTEKDWKKEWSKMLFVYSRKKILNSSAFERDSTDFISSLLDQQKKELIEELLKSLPKDLELYTEKEIDDIVSVNEGNVSDLEIMQSREVEMRIRNRTLSEVRKIIENLK